MSAKKILIIIATPLISILLLISPPKVSAGPLDIFTTPISNTVDAIKDPAGNLEKVAVGFLEVSVDAALLALDIDGGTQSSEPSSGLIPVLASSISKMYQNPPAETGQYFAYMSRNIFPRAYAQGVGYKGLSPIIEVWSVFRNVTYFFFVILFIVVGFMIMFRSKINPQTVISMQNALPRIVVTLILVTFSFAIAGLIIDLMYFLTFLAISVLYAGTDKIPEVSNIFLNKGIIELFLSDVFNGEVFNLSDFARNNTSSIAGGFGGALGSLISGALPGILSSSVSSFVISKIFLLIAGIILFYTLLRLFFILLITFVNIIISIIFAPFMIAFNALPGSNAFVNWIKSLLANVLVFPAVAIFIMIAGLLVGSGPLSAPGVGYADSPSGGFLPPLMISARSATKENVDEIQAIIAFGMLLLLPSLAQAIKDALKVEPFKYGKDIAASASKAFVPLKFVFEQRRARKSQQKQQQDLVDALNASRG